MIGIAKNYDMLCYHLKVVHKNLDDPGKMKVDAFFQGVRTDLLESKTSLAHTIEEKFPLILDLRLAALKWIVTKGENLAELLDNEAYPYFEQMAEIERLSSLSENVLFALRCNKKVINALLTHIGKEEFSNDILLDIPAISFDQFIASIYLSVPNVEGAKAMIEWAKCSFQIEYAICAAALIYDEKLMVSSEKINELSSIIVNAAQTYSAIALEVGILPSKKENRQTTDIIDNSGFLEEQKNLAEAGINLFAKNWKD
jgi:hypothetical protein